MIKMEVVIVRLGIATLVMVSHSYYYFHYSSSITTTIRIIVITIMKKTERMLGTEGNNFCIVKQDNILPSFAVIVVTLT